MKILKDKEYNELMYNNLRLEERVRELQAFLEYRERELKRLDEEIKDLQETNLEFQKKIIDLEREARNGR